MSTKRKPITGFNLAQGIKAFTPTSKRDEEVVNEELQLETENESNVENNSQAPQKVSQIHSVNLEENKLSNSSILETKNEQSNQVVAKQIKKADEKGSWEDAFARELYLIPNQVVTDLENTVHDLKQVFRKGRISKSKIAAIAISRLIFEYQEKGPESVLFKEMYKILA